MSWAKHNPELYEEICKKGVVAKLRATFKAVWTEPFPEESESIDHLVEAIQQEAPKLWDALVAESFMEIGEAERDWWGGQIDAVRDRAKYDEEFRKKLEGKG